MSIIDNLFRNKRNRSAQIAKERLLTVLVHDRVKLTPDMMEQLKRELSAVIAHYVPYVDPDDIMVSLERVETSDHLRADIPLRRAP